MARVEKVPSATPPFGKTPLKHGAKVEIVSLNSGTKVKIDTNGALRANSTTSDYNSGDKFVVSQLGAAVMLQCAMTNHILGASAGYLYGFRANQQQAALRVYYHEDSGAIEFETCADPGKFLAFDRRGNIIPLGGVTTGISRQFAVRIVETTAKQEPAKSSLNSLLSMGKKAVKSVIGEGETQVNFERNKLRGVMLNGARIRLMSKVTGRYLAIMANGIVHGNGDSSEVLIVRHCMGILRYSFQSEKYPQLYLCVTLDNITWAMANRSASAGKENPAMVWCVDKCRSDGTVLLRRNTQLSNGIIHQYLGFATNGKPTPTLIAPEELGDMIIQSANAPLHALANPPVPVQGAAPAAAPVSAVPPPTVGSAPAAPDFGSAPAAPVLDYGSAPPPPAYDSPGSGGQLYAMPPGALLYEGSTVLLRNKIGYIGVSGNKVDVIGTQNKDCDWNVLSPGFMVFKFQNAKNGGFLSVKGSNVELGADSEAAVFQVRFNPNGSVSFQSTVSDSVFIGVKDPEIFLEMA